MPISIRPATESDAPSLSSICLLTGNAGTSAEHLFKHGEFPGLVFAVPYVKLAHTFGFVLVDDATGEIGGYILGTTDTRAFEREAHERWWPAIQAQYPVDEIVKMEANGTATAEDVRFAKLFGDMWTQPDACIAFSPVHLHIDILPTFQRQGWGKKLIGRVVELVREQGINGLWVGLDPKNESGKKFYERLGFRPIECEGVSMGLSFENWKD